jgi:hypothetical protein
MRIVRKSVCPHPYEFLPRPKGGYLYLIAVSFSQPELNSLGCVAIQCNAKIVKEIVVCIGEFYILIRKLLDGVEIHWLGIWKWIFIG